METSIGQAMNPAHTEESTVFTQPVRLSGADGADDSSVFEEVKPRVRISRHLNPVEGRSGTRFHPIPLFSWFIFCSQLDRGHIHSIK